MLAPADERKERSPLHTYSGATTPRSAYNSIVLLLYLTFGPAQWCASLLLQRGHNPPTKLLTSPPSLLFLYDSFSASTHFPLPLV
jgi:hypothetical protein